MRIFKRFKIDNEKRTPSELYLDDNDIFHELSSLDYEIHLTLEEHKKLLHKIETHVVRALFNEINVYCAYERANRFMLLDKELVTSRDSIIAFSTTDEGKYEMLESIVKDLINDVKKNE